MKYEVKMNRRNMIRGLLAACGVMYGNRVALSSQMQQQSGQSTGIRMVIDKPITWIVEGKPFTLTPPQIKALFESKE